jgi:hypothetical protein
MSTSTFDHFYGLGRTQLHRAHARSVTFTPLNGVAVPINAMVGAEMDELLEDASRRTLLRQRPVTVKNADVSDANRGDVFSIDGEDWTVERKLARQNGEIRVLVVRPERVDPGGRVKDRR